MKSGQRETRTIGRIPRRFPNPPGTGSWPPASADDPAVKGSRVQPSFPPIPFDQSQLTDRIEPVRFLADRYAEVAVDGRFTDILGSR